jgi:hypothetical protein
VCNTKLAKKNKDKTGRCRCVQKGKACTASRNCCNAMTCTDGNCQKAGPTCTVAYAPEVAGLAGPVGIAVRDGKVYVVNSHAKTIGSFALDGTGYTEGQVPAASFIQGLAVNPVDNKLYVVFQSGEINEVDPVTLAISSTWASGIGGTGSYGIVFDAADAAWVTTMDNEMIKIKQGDTNAEFGYGPICVSGHPRGLAFGPGGLLYMACDGSGQVVAINKDLGVPSIAGPSVPGAFGIAFSGSKMYVSQFDPSTVSQFNVVSGDPSAIPSAPTYTPVCVHAMPAGSSPTFMAYDATGKLWVNAFDGNTCYSGSFS